MHWPGIKYIKVYNSMGFAGYVAVCVQLYCRGKLCKIQKKPAKQVPSRT
jgi:hypothetical protein